MCHCLLFSRTAGIRSDKVQCPPVNELHCGRGFIHVTVGELDVWTATLEFRLVSSCDCGTILKESMNRSVAARQR